MIKSVLTAKAFIKKYQYINLCGGEIDIPGYCNIDLAPRADIVLDLEKSNIPYPDESVDGLVCISAINYFDRDQGQSIINDVYRIIKKGGVVRFASQDLRIIAEYYVNKNADFFFQQGSNGKDRFVGTTMADKFNSWFYGYETVGNKHCKYVYDYDTLEHMFKRAGFTNVKQMPFGESALSSIEIIDNRPEQMFFLEAIK